MTFAFDRKYLVAFAIAVAGFGALVALGVDLNGHVRSAAADVDRARDFRQQIDTLHATLLEMESSQRGYLLTLKPVYLEPYRRAEARLDSELDALSNMVAGNEARSAQVASLRALSVDKRAELARTIAIADTQGIAAALVVVGSDAGKASMDAMRSVLERMTLQESRLLALRQSAVAASIHSGLRAAALLGGVMATLLGLVYLLMSREQTQGRRTSAAESELMAALERGVLERTQRLEESKIALEMSQARLSGIVESASDAIVTVDARQVIVQANSAAARMFCCPVAELVGGPIERFVPERFRQAHQRDIETFGTSPVSSRHMGHQRDVAALRADGQEFFSEASISHLMVNGQRLYTVILRDRTDRRAAEAELQTSQAKLEAALSSMNDAVAIFDAQGRCLEFNDAFTTFHRFSGPIECRAMLDDAPHLLDVSTDRGEPAAPQHQPVARALQGEAASNVEYHLRRTDTGEAWTGSYSYAPIRSLDDAIVGAVVTARDVTAQRKAQAELEASNATLQRLIAAQDKVEEEERKRIARELHDDLQQTLAGIRIDLGLIGERLTADPAGVRSLVSEADRLALAAVVSTRRIVNDLRPLILEELGLVPALEALTSRFAERSGIDCRLEVVGVADDALAHLPTVTSSLYRVTQEALNNVAKHAQATVVQIKFDRTANDLLTLRISDDGIGMSRREQRHAGSFGLLGMTERVRALGGQLRIDSDAGKGTTIEVLVPIPHQAAASGGAAGRAVDKTHPLAAALDPLGSTGELAGMKRESGHPLQNVIDALTGNVAVLDRSGTIQMVNRAWREFARRHGYSDRGGSGIGTSYLDVCRDSAKRDASLEPVLRGLQEVLGGSRDAFVTEYPCELPDGTNWFRMHAAPVTGGIVIVSHVNLSARLSSQPPSASDETFSPAASTSH